MQMQKKKERDYSWDKMQKFIKCKYPRLKRRGFIGEQHDAKELGIHPQAKASGFLPRGNNY